MRKIERIDPFLKALGEYWKKVPDWRFGQLIVNVFPTSEIDPWFLEEPDMLNLFDKYFKEEKSGK